MAQSASEILILPVAPAPPVQSNLTQTPVGLVGVPYYDELTATAVSVPTAGRYVGVPSDGLALDPNGAIIGTPTTVETASFTLQVSDAQLVPSTSTEYVSIRIAPGTPLTIVSTTVPAGAVAVNYPQTALDAFGPLGLYTWSVVTGVLPAGMSLDATDGVISGTPTAGGTFVVTVGVTDAETVPVTAIQALDHRRGTSGDVHLNKSIVNGGPQRRAGDLHGHGGGTGHAARCCDVPRWGDHNRFV